jgi:hypothetical protein
MSMVMEQYRSQSPRARLLIRKGLYAFCFFLGGLLIVATDQSIVIAEVLFVAALSVVSWLAMVAWNLRRADA